MSFTYKFTLAPYVYEELYKAMNDRGLVSVKAAAREVMLETAASDRLVTRALVLAISRAAMKGG